MESVELRPGRILVFEPGGLHIMLEGLSSPLEEGERFPLTFSFERGAPITVQVEVRGVGAMSISAD